VVRQGGASVPLLPFARATNVRAVPVSGGAPLRDTSVSPTVSVVIPVRNRSSVVLRALRSVTDQSFPDLETVVVDDASTDNTADAVRAYAGTDPRVHLFRHESPCGAQAARNTGVRAASGEWVAFLDSDDWWLPDSLSLRLAAAAATAAPVVHSACLVCRSDSEGPVPFSVPPLSGRVYRDLLRRPGPVFPALLVKRSALNEIGGMDEQIIAFQEWDTAIRLARLASFAFVAEPTFVYDGTRADSISKDLKRNAEGYRMIVSKHRRAITTQLGPKGLSDHWATLAGLYRAAGDARRARTFLVAAALLWPFRPAFIKRRLVVRRFPRDGAGQ
jgi:glycosyltransferase involved in cell wall biosynthesis